MGEETSEEIIKRIQDLTIEEYIALLEGQVQECWEEREKARAGKKNDAGWLKYAQSNKFRHEAYMEKFRQDFTRKEYAKGVEATTELRVSDGYPSRDEIIKIILWASNEVDKGELEEQCFADGVLSTLAWMEGTKPSPDRRFGEDLSK